MISFPLGRWAPATVRAFGVALVCLCALWSPAFAQHGDGAPADSLDAQARERQARSRSFIRDAPAERVHVEEVEPSFSRRLLALQRRAKSDPEGALPGMEELFEENPGDHQLRLLLARVYRDLGRLDRAEAILRSLLVDFPAAAGYRDELIRVLLRNGSEAEGLALLRNIYEGGQPRAGGYEEAASLLQGAGRYDLIEEVYRKGLAALPAHEESGRLRLLRRLLDHLSFEQRPADLLRTVAAEMLGFSPVLRQRLLEHSTSLLVDSGRDDELLALADSLAAGEHGPELAAALSGLYLSAGDYTRFAERVIQARIQGLDRPYWLFEEGERCLQGMSGDPAEQRRAAASIFDTVLALSTEVELRNRCRLELAGIRLDEDAEQRLRGDPPGETEVAELRGLLAKLRDEMPGSTWAGRALLLELRFVRDRLGNAAAADALLRDWLVDPNRGSDRETLWALELELGENLLAQDKVGAARGHFESMSRTVRAPLLMSWVRYRLCQLDILAGDLSAAQDSLAALAKDEPGGLLANDALDLALLLAESSTWPGTVREFLSGALALEFTSRPLDAAGRLLAFTREFTDDPAAPGLLYRAGQLLEEGYDGRGAIAAWTELADHHAADFRAPQGLEMASRLALRIGDRPLARLLLERLEDEHPDFPMRPGLRDLQARLTEEI